MIYDLDRLDPPVRSAVICVSAAIVGLALATLLGRSFTLADVLVTSLVGAAGGYAGGWVRVRLGRAG